MKFSDVSEKSNFAEQGAVYVVHIDPAHLVELTHANSVVRKYAQDEDEGLATQLSDQLRNARFRIVTSILPFNSDALKLFQIAQSVDAIRNQLTEGTELHHEANRACEALLDLLMLKINPVGEKVIELLSDVPEKDRLLALTNGFYAESTSEYLRREGIQSRVVTGRTLHNLGAIDNLICVGSPTISFFPKAIWTTPMADSTCFIHYPLGWRAPTVDGLFAGGTPLGRPKLIEAGESFGFRDVEPFDFVESAREAVERAARRHAIKGGEENEAYFIALAKGWAVWTEVDDHNQMMCVDVSDLNNPLIMKKAAKSITQGDFLVLRTGGSDPDFIRAIANARFGAQSERSNQVAWKAAFKRAIDENGGLENARSQLADLGVSTSNFRYWLRPKCISPQKESDFVKLCVFSGIGEKAEGFWKSMRAIHRAHLKAGQQVRRELEKNLLEGGINQLADSGLQEYVIEGFGMLAAYQVQFVSPDHSMVSTSVIDQPFIAEEDGWPG